MQRDGPILLDIYHAALRVQRFTAGLPRDRFKEAEETQSAVLYQLIVIGEAVSRLSDEFRTQHPVAPWRKIVGLRNIITHQ